MKKLLLILLVLTSVSSYACQDLFGEELEKTMLEKVTEDLKSLSWGEGAEGAMYVVKAANMGPLKQINDSTLAFSVKLQMVGEFDPSFKKEVFGILSYDVKRNCETMHTVLSSGEKILKFN